MSFPLPRRGLYAVTTERLGDAVLLEAVASALRGGIVLLQFRDKRPPSDTRKALAQQLCVLCHAAGVPFVVNDDVALAQAVGADGVHLGKDDAQIAEARAALGPAAIVGISCYDSVARARAAQAAGASYVAFGRFFPSASKPQAAPAAFDTLRQAKAELRVPIVAIGGITPSNGSALVEAGADLLAVIEGLFGQKGVEETAKAYSRLFR